MLIKVKPGWWISENHITPEHVHRSRRGLLKSGALMAVASAMPAGAFGSPLYDVKEKERPLTPEKIATSYNNFYEFSLEKDGVKPLAEKWKIPIPWKVEIAGLTEQKMSYDFEDLAKMAGGSEERIYRFRCVEAWSAVIPWTGFPLSKLIPKLKPKKSAKYLAFTSYSNEKDLPNIKKLSYYPWPYTEGLTMEEAMNPLTLLSTGMYGKPLPGQNGAPIRLVTPWKYGFKSIKSIVRIEFTDKQPKTLWNQLAPGEYGFYANVNPAVDHPRWSQATERILDGKLFPTRIKTLPYNGYEKEVSSLYAGLDLKINY